ncbi:MAG TPA: 2'-5' RNA ligase family protein [Actinomycetes bacterium]|nr:2'-5' RNA ligase family protein [Actinomycetes bacterium]
MVHSVEVLLDERSERWVRRQWAVLAEAGLPSASRHGSASNRPHLTLAAYQRIPVDLHPALRSVAEGLPVTVRLEGLLVFGKDRSRILVRAAVRTAELAALQERVRAICGECPLPADKFDDADWMPHVTLARRMSPDQLAGAVGVLDTRTIVAQGVGLRHWDGERHEEHVLRAVGGQP